jgi:hypothetical protein
VVVVEEEYCPEITYRYTGLAIRQYLLAVGAGSAYDFYRCFRRVKPDTSYESIKRYFYLLRRAGLIVRVGTAPPRRGGVEKVLYAVVPERVDDPGWFHPQQIFYPQTRLGKSRYRRLKGG